MLASRKILLSLAAVGAAASIATMGTFATFTDTASSTTGNISSGTVDINLAASGASNRLSIGATGLVPGDTLQRRAVLTNAGSEDLASVSLTTTAGTSSILDTDATDGLQMKIERCTNGTWTESATTPYTYTCDLVPGTGLNNGTRGSVLARRSVIGPTMSLTSMGSLTAGGTDDVVITLDLPTTAGNSFQSKTSTIVYTFNATQRAATSK